ncbi:Translation factor guf1 mitochondrial [Malassezia vespertilionis]|uniref:Translation factor guf1 mitochondrial n=1 Tax=Malassezia vespertilionis TaxID=2020962 RepID=UPI0024B1E6A8|nr:Translation factor guf1 mitochondrial [Malassezia vespertilionis]WFD06337.1 Translation factor guf1 mitochondrial [Malassezia vespertilionis]
MRGAAGAVRTVLPYDTLETRSFSIIAHIDHGKSTLADRLLEHTQTIPSDGSNKQVLDKLKVERERGITVKSQAVSMLYKDPNRTDTKPILLNLIDTPGHVDFAYEVRRSLSVCQSALLVVDATQGIQAQSISVFKIAQQCGVKIIPVLNKVDLPASNPARCVAQLSDILGIDMADPANAPLLVSAKTGEGVDKVLHALISRTQPLLGVEGGAIEQRGLHGLRALVFDSWYDKYRGVIALTSIVDGAVRKGDHIASMHTGKKYEVLDLGVHHPGPISTPVLRKGQVGWIITNMKDTEEASVGDTFHRVGERIEALPGFRPAVPTVFAGIFPTAKTDFLKLEDAIQRLAINDRSITMQRESMMALGQGYRLGFLGTLHLDVFRQRLEDEYGHEIIVTTPTVPFRITYKNGAQVLCSNPVEFPDESVRKTHVADMQEPTVLGSLVCPEEYTGAMMELCAEHRGEQLDIDFSNAGATQVHMLYKLPLAEVVTDFFDKLKSRSSGFASFDYEDGDYASSDLIKLRFLVANAPVDALELVLHRSKAVQYARMWVKKLKDAIPRQQFEIKIQACAGSKVLASETQSAYRKDVTAGLYGGHYERKLKHLNKQKEGKKKLKAMSLGRVRVPQEVFVKILDTRKK